MTATGPGPRPWPPAAARSSPSADQADVMRFRGPSTRIVERPDAFATPGLIDAHGHMESLGASQEAARLARRRRRSRKSRDGCKARVEATPGDSWITGRNWDQSLWPGGAFPTAAVLDAVAPAPSRSGSSGSTATRAGPTRRRCGGPRSTKDSKAPADGQIIRDSARACQPASSSTGRWAWSAARSRLAIQGRSEAPAARGPGDRCSSRD